MGTEPMSALGPGEYMCGECGATVVSKEILPGGQYQTLTGYRQMPDYLGPNRPCGHDAMAIYVPSDADTLWRAAGILRRRARRPWSLPWRLLIGSLERHARLMERDASGESAVA